MCLREIRKEKGISIEEVAYKAEIDAQNLRKYELGKQEMKVSMLKRIADALDMRISEITDRIGE
ncbi:MAG: helix-turn-helix transcriptional regulator [Flavobacteriales bacterium]|nr:helix-turn-helix transcriptional regulator [Flavobacteriales bacterium]